MKYNVREMLNITSRDIVTMITTIPFDKDSKQKQEFLETFQTNKLSEL